MPKPFGIIRKALPLAPTLLLRDANRRRAALSVGNMAEMFDSRLSFKERYDNPEMLNYVRIGFEYTKNEHSNADIRIFGSPAGDSVVPVTSPSIPITAAPSRSVSFGSLSSGNATSQSPGHADRPMRLPEIYAAAEAAIQSTITNEKLKDALSSVEKFEV